MMHMDPLEEKLQEKARQHILLYADLWESGCMMRRLRLGSDPKGTNKIRAHSYDKTLCLGMLPI